MSGIIDRGIFAQGGATAIQWTSDRKINITVIPSICHLWTWNLLRMRRPWQGTMSVNQKFNSNSNSNSFIYQRWKHEQTEYWRILMLVSTAAVAPGDLKKRILVGEVLESLECRKRVVYVGSLRDDDRLAPIKHNSLHSTLHDICQLILTTSEVYMILIQLLGNDVWLIFVEQQW